MIHTADWYVLFVFGCSLLGLLVSVILYFVNKDMIFPARMLAGFLTCSSLVGLNNALMATNFFSNLPHLWRAVSFVSFLPPAFSYIYVRSVLHQEYRFRRTDWWFFVPSFIYILSMLPFFLQPSAQKLELIDQLIADNNLIVLEPENLMSGGVFSMARTLYGLVTTIAIIVLLKRYKSRISVDITHLSKNLSLYKWLIFFAVMVSFLYVSLFFIVLLHLKEWLHVWEMVAFVISITVLFTCISVLVRPAIMYGFSGWLQLEARIVPTETTANAVPSIDASAKNDRKTNLTQAQGLEIKLVVENFLSTHQPYLRSNYKLAELSIDTNIPSYLLSAFVNQHYGKNFNEFINDYRVNYLFNLLQTDRTKFEHYTLAALSKIAGFNSRNAFIAAVKRKTGMTPSEFYSLKELA